MATSPLLFIASYDFWGPKKRPRFLCAAQGRAFFNKELENSATLSSGGTSRFCAPGDLIRAPIFAWVFDHFLRLFVSKDNRCVWMQSGIFLWKKKCFFFVCALMMMSQQRATTPWKLPPLWVGVMSWIFWHFCLQSASIQIAGIQCKMHENRSQQMTASKLKPELSIDKALVNVLPSWKPFLLLFSLHEEVKCLLRGSVFFHLFVSFLTTHQP